MSHLNFSFMEVGDKIHITPNGGGSVHYKLPPGIYAVHHDPNFGRSWFQKFSIVNDAILDLPSPEYHKMTSEMQHFLKPETKVKFNKMGYLYKRSALLHGAPGTGKTCIVNRIVRDVVNSKGIVLYADDVDLLRIGLLTLSDTQPDDLVMVIFEEFDKLAKRSESDLLTILDGQEQKSNVMYLATTNYLERIPKRLYRPGRFSSVIEVKYPIPEARRMYLESKLGADYAGLEKWVEVSEGLSVDELKEMIQSVELLGQDLTATVARLRDTRSTSSDAELDEFESAHKTLSAIIDSQRNGLNGFGAAALAVSTPDSKRSW